MVFFSRQNIIRIAVLLIGTGFSAPAQALETGWVSDAYVQARLIAHQPAGNIVAADHFEGGLELKLAAGWHAYWHLPGDSGLAPQFDFSASENLETFTLHWPFPQRLETEGLQSFIYQDRVMFPLDFVRRDAAQDTALNLTLDVMVCNEICVPQKIALNLNVPPGAGNDRNAALINRARALVPVPEDRPGLKIRNIVIGPQALVISAFSQRGFDDADLFIEMENGEIISAAPELLADEGERREAMLRIALPEDVERSGAVTVTLTDGREAVTRRAEF